MSNVHTDHYFHIGYSHLLSGKPAQDYAISGVHDGLGYAALSDGCSTGGDTDVGARLIALSSKTAIFDYWNMNGRLDIFDSSITNEIDMRQKIVLQGMQHTLGLEIEDLLATSMYAMSSGESSIVRILGDGVVAIKYKSGEICMYRFEWCDNIPFYPAYQNGLLKYFIESHGGNLQTPRLIRTEYFTEISPNEFEMNYSLKEGISGISLPIEHKDVFGEVEFVILFSDGITQIDGVSWTEAVVELTNFKSLKGEFVKRRIIAGIKKFQKIGKGPLDDIACSVIRVD